jgi:7,8-dihydro-6-hydroxymethylpterin-pyrophosphokinase (HPPK)
MHLRLPGVASGAIRSVNGPQRIPFAMTRLARSIGGVSSLHSDTARHRAFIALGSNVGDRIHMIESAVVEMKRRGVDVLRTSSLWETEPMYVQDQGRFLNGACEVCPLSSYYAVASHYNRNLGTLKMERFH